MCYTKIYITVASLAFLVVTKGANTTLPLTYPGQVLQGDGSRTCHFEEQLGIVRNELDDAILSLLGESVVPILQGDTFVCGGSTGWRRVAYLNMSDPSQQCPSVWQEITTPFRVCGRRSNTFASCEGLNYTTGGEQYDQVCGRIIGYQIGSPDAFTRTDHLIDSYYMDGISTTRGFPRQHIWSFVGGLDEMTTYDACPCVTRSTTRDNIPSFVGQNYFCESGITQWNSTNNNFYSNSDPLWDGQGCGPSSSCCTFNSPPWFNVTLSPPTTDDIEVKICGDEGIENEDTPIQLMELYVK